MKAKKLKKSRIRFIMTWVSLAVLLLAGLGMIVLSWNGVIRGKAFPSLLILCWLLISAAGIYLFMMAAKKSHRLLELDERRMEEPEPRPERRTGRKQDKDLDVTAKARKMVRRIPEGGSIEDTGKALIEVLAKELEIMSGVLYYRKGEEFTEVTNYALNSPTGPLSFREGEGLPGQVARNRQIMVLTRLPEGYLEVFSGLGKAEPAYVAIVPFVRENRTEAVLECAGYRYDPKDIESVFRIFSRDLSENLFTATGE